MRPHLVLLNCLNCLAARVGIVFTCARRVLSGKPGSDIGIRAAACGNNGNKLGHDPSGGGVVPWPVLLVALATSLAFIVLFQTRRAPIPPICMVELEVVVRSLHDFRGSWLNRKVAEAAGWPPPRWPSRRAPSRDAMNGLDSKPETESRLAANCRASLCRSLQEWALQGKQREAAAIEALALRVVAEAAQAPAGGSLGDTQEPPAAAQIAERLRVQHDVALLCSAPWQRAVQGGVDESAWLQSAQRRGYTSAEAMARGMESMCRRLHRVQSNLLARGSTCRHWPEPCWPAPGVPFSRSVSWALQRLDVNALARYLVFAMSEEQLSNARSHLVEAARVARMANRVLVLPLVRVVLLGSHSQIDLSHPTFLSFPYPLPRSYPHFPPLFPFPLSLPLFAPHSPLSRARGCIPGEQQPDRPLAAPAALRLLGPRALGCGALDIPGALPAAGARSSQGALYMVSEFTGELLTFALGHVPTEHNTLLFNMPANKHDIENLVRKQYASQTSATPTPLLYPNPDPTYKHRSNKDVGEDKDVVLWFKTTWERVSFEPHTDDIALQQLPYKHELHYLAASIVQRLPKPFLALHFRSEFIAFRVVGTA
ncbi:unnamed protein product [Closterium sp. NIES-64]|nr:unnamed protein product [Closterium sp. NIES-64]